MNKAHLPSLPENEQRSPTGKFHSFSKNISLALGAPANTGTWGGGHPFDLQIRRIPPGAAVCPFHAHLGQWELFVVRQGAGTVRTSDGSFAIKTGDVFFHPPGTPHQLASSGPGDLEVLIVADNPPLDSCHYPDSHKRSLRPPGMFFRTTEAHYFDGEDALPPDAAAYRASPSPAFPPAAPFVQRKVNLGDLPWEPWTSPKKKFRGTSKELSIALGAKRNTPTGLGGHPFDLELGRLAPGECGCPFHSHAAQWELYLIESGVAQVRTAAGGFEAVTGDAFVFPPGEAHQFTNAGNGDLVYVLVTDNPPVDYCHYPDSDKWGFRAPRKFFRTAEIDYWDGEE